MQIRPGRRGRRLRGRRHAGLAGWLPACLPGYVKNPASAFCYSLLAYLFIVCSLVLGFSIAASANPRTRGQILDLHMGYPRLCVHVILPDSRKTISSICHSSWHVDWWWSRGPYWPLKNMGSCCSQSTWDVTLHGNSHANLFQWQRCMGGTCMCVMCMYVCVCIYIYIYTHVCIERER